MTAVRLAALRDRLAAFDGSQAEALLARLDAVARRNPLRRLVVGRRWSERDAVLCLQTDNGEQQSPRQFLADQTLTRAFTTLWPLTPPAPADQITPAAFAPRGFARGEEGDGSDADFTAATDDFDLLLGPPSLPLPASPAEGLIALADALLGLAATGARIVRADAACIMLVAGTHRGRQRAAVGVLRALLDTHTPGIALLIDGEFPEIADGADSSDGLHLAALPDLGRLVSEAVRSGDAGPLTAWLTRSCWPSVACRVLDCPHCNGLRKRMRRHSRRSGGCC